MSAVARPSYRGRAPRCFQPLDIDTPTACELKEQGVRARLLPAREVSLPLLCSPLAANETSHLIQGLGGVVDAQPDAAQHQHGQQDTSPDDPTCSLATASLDYFVGGLSCEFVIALSHH